VLTGNKNFLPETLKAYETGTRIEATSKLSFSVSGFYDIYDNLRSVEVSQATTLPTIWIWGNLMQADTYGVEAWSTYSVTDWWQLKAAFNIQHEDRRFELQSSGLGGVAIAGDDPNHQASLQSTMSFAQSVSWQADLRWIGMLPNPAVPAYVELNSRLAWRVSDSIELALAGFNLLHAHHLEYEEAGTTTGNEVDRSFLIETKLRF
jgi:iron complex outermembrane receptor protein